MEVADEIVVINEGRIEQIGSPDTLYDAPANDFVMGFLGEVTTLGTVKLRPHDIAVSRTPGLAGAIRGTVDRMLRVGFEVRLSVLTDEGQVVTVRVTRAQARSLALDVDVEVWLTPAPVGLHAVLVSSMAGATPAADAG